ncbi:hypothetical protein ACOMHN_018743 [Nucella lapillus]
MFRLATPIASAQPISDFDDISTIITHSSLTSSRTTAPWQRSLQDNGHVFYVELTKPPHPHPPATTLTPDSSSSNSTCSRTDARSVCSLCSTRSCHSCASADTGYSSDADAGSSLWRGRRADRSLLDSSHDDSLSLQSSHAGDFDDDEDDDVDDFVDDGVSLDLLLDADWLRKTSRPRWDVEKELADFAATTKAGRQWGGVGGGDPCEKPRGCQVRSGPREASSVPSSGCRGTSSLCKRHYSYKAGASQACRPKADWPSGLAPSCKCRARGLGGGVKGEVGVKKGQGERDSVIDKQGQQRVPNKPGQERNSYREVVLRLGPSQSSTRDSGGSAVSWLETSLGIVPGVAAGQASGGSGGGDARGTPGHCRGGEGVVIEALLPGGPAAKSNELTAGEYSTRIRDGEMGTSAKPPVREFSETTFTARMGSATTPGTSDGVGVVYMSLSEGGGEKEEEGEDVVYEFPGERGGDGGLVGGGESWRFLPPGKTSVGRRLRGCFFTLHHLLAEGGSDSRVRLLRVGVGSSEVNVSCWKEGQDLLIVTAPQHRLPPSQLLTMTQTLVRLVRLLYGSLDQAFGSRDNHEALDQFLACMFSPVQPGPLTGSYSSLPASLPGYMDYLPLPDDVLAGADSESRRSFTILGSMAMYKGHVTCSHLPAEDAKDVWTFLQDSGLRQLTATTPTTTTTTTAWQKPGRQQHQHQHHQQQLQQMMVWREIHPTRQCHEVGAINNVFGYSEPHARWFLLVLGLKNTLLACILEAGGYSTQLEGSCGPDPLFVDQARAALVQLQSPDILSACEIRLSGEGLPPTVTADQTILPTTTTTTPTTPSPGPPSLQPSPHLGSSGSRGLARPPHHHHPPLPPGERGGGWRREEGFVKTRVKTSPLCHPTSRNAIVSNSGGHVVCSDVNTCKLGSGRENSLFVFCQVNQQEGVIVSSPAAEDDRQGAGSSLALHRHVTENFHRCVAQIHANFAPSAVPKGYRGGGVLEDLDEDQSMAGCREEGVMFTCPLTPRHDGKKAIPCLVYWVVGRKFRHAQSREVYVCFSEATPQNVVDVAFRLSLGSPS